MSYSITIKITDGTAAVTSQSGSVPEGTINVNGHEDATYASIGLTRHRADGTAVVQATSVSYPGAFAEVTS